MICDLFSYYSEDQQYNTTIITLIFCDTSIKNFVNSESTRVCRYLSIPPGTPGGKINSF